MEIDENVSLKSFSTMRLGGNASFLAKLSDKNELPRLVNWAKSKNLPIIMIGQGSNIVWRDEGYQGLVIVNRLLGFEVTKEDNQTAFVTIGAGENWDDVVNKTVELGLNGIAELSLIPGTVGATPVQNVGAYGKEISQNLVTLEVFDIEKNQLVIIPASDCNFAYRTSRFKTSDKGKFFITAITLMLTKDNPSPPFYESLESYFKQNDIAEYTPEIVRQAVVEIRSSKLPDPMKIANVGSFFANPVIDNFKYNQLSARFHGMKSWPMDDNKTKLSAAWLIDNVGYKDFHDQETGIGTWPKQSLVLVNEHAKSTADLLKFKKNIVDMVNKKFGVLLIQEPELI